MVFCTIFFGHISQESLCNKKLIFVFQLHRMAMIITWCLTIISFAVIFIDLDGWTDPYPHEIFGMIATIICFVQPIIAMFRPNVSSPKRKYFTIVHLTCGSIVYGLASKFSTYDYEYLRSVLKSHIKTLLMVISHFVSQSLLCFLLYHCQILVFPLGSIG